MTATDCVQALVATGFTPIEAEVYAFLLGESPVTGYRAAQALGKSVGNIYKALESLEDKGAVLVDQGESRLCRAVPTDELLSQLDRQYARRRGRAEKALAGFAATENDDCVYRLRSRDQAFERCRSMLRGAQRVALVIATKEQIEELRGEIEATAVRGVTVGVKSYEPVELCGATVIVDPRGKAVVQRGPGRWIHISTDSREFISVLLTEDGRTLLDGIWTAGIFVAWVSYSHMYSNVVLAVLKRMIEDGSPTERIAEALRRYEELGPLDPPGKELLMQRYRAGVRPRRKPRKN